MFRRYLIVLSTVIAAAAPTTTADAGTTQSIEWRAAHNDVVITGNVTRVRVDSIGKFAVDVHVTHTLKGASRPDVTFVYWAFGDSKGQAFSPAKGEALFFLLRGVDIPPGRRNDPVAWERLTLEDREVNSLQLTTLAQASAWSCTFKPLKTIDEISAAIASAPARTSPPRPIHLTPPQGSPAFATLGPAEDFVVPDDDRWKLPYLQYVMTAPDWWTQVRNRPDLKAPATIAFATTLLNDPSCERRAADHWPRSILAFDRRDYHVRRAAMRVLGLWNVHVDPPVLEEPLLPGRHVPREFVFAPLLIVPFLVFPRRVPLPRRLWNLATALSLITAAALGALWIQSRSTYVALLFTTPSGEHEFSSARGQFAYLYVDDRPTAQEPVLRRAPLDDTLLLPDHLDHFVPAETINHVGVQRTRGTTPAINPGPRRTLAAGGFAYSLLQIRYPTLLLAAVLIPFARVTTLIAHTTMARRRRARGCCEKCGYDLRSSAGRCPECGRDARPV